MCVCVCQERIGGHLTVWRIVAVKQVKSGISVHCIALDVSSAAVWTKDFKSRVVLQ